MPEINNYYGFNPYRDKEYRIPVTDSTYLALLEVPSREKRLELTIDEYNRNIYYVDKNRKVIWRIKTKVDHLEEAGGPFVGIRKTFDGIFLAYRYDSIYFLIDIQSGWAEEDENITWHLGYIKYENPNSGSAG